MEYIEPLHFRDKVYNFRIKEFDPEIDLEELLQVDINNIVADIITFPVIFNRISAIKVDLEDLERQTKHTLDVTKARRYNHYRLSLIYDEQIVTSSGKETGVMKKIKPTDGVINSHVECDEEVIQATKDLFAVKRQVGFTDSIYWSAKDKSKKLEVVSAKLKPEEFEYDILEGEINSVLIKSSKALIK